ncbi:NAD(P)H-hydrate dehydratase, partial [candidate division WOR-3 bacterium]|nr:NAD(P)H-hydrate dehydratase [candidate division WOR-3 bacterium]
LAGDAIRLVNDSGARVFAVDVPSGVDSDTGATHDPAVRAQHTITMGLAKVGLWLYPGRALAGRVHVADIGFPAPLLADGARTYLVGDADVRQRLPPRPPDGHKGTFGTALIVAGSRGFSGAACLSAQAAVRSGVGLVRLAVPRALGDVVSTRTLEPVKLVLPQTYNEVLGFNALDPLLEASAQADAVAVGPGISTDPEVRKLVLELLPGVEKPLVVDADGLNNLVGALGVLDDLKAPAVLTPHPGELGRLLGTSAADINARRVEVARDFAGRHRCILVLKGAATVVAEPQGRVFVNPTGNSGLGSGGTGDVLTGLLTGLIAQGVPPLDAAIVAVFLHGRAADIAAAEVTEYCLCASDLLDYLPRAFRSVLDPASG